MCGAAVVVGVDTGDYGSAVAAVRAAHGSRWHGSRGVNRELGFGNTNNIGHNEPPPPYPLHRRLHGLPRARPPPLARPPGREGGR